MTDDRALLEAAAKAAGLSITWGEKYYIGPDEVDCTDLPYVRSDSPDESPAYWNPLEDDGDALRLAVKLGLVIYMPDDDDKTVVVRTSLLGSAPRFMEEAKRADPYAATRRAIVRAAAASLRGERMEG